MFKCIYNPFSYPLSLHFKAPLMTIEALRPVASAGGSLGESEPPAYVAPAMTKENLDYADLAIIDLSKANTPAGRAELAVELCDAMKTKGFFYAINHGYTQEQTNQMFSISQLAFDGVSDEEKVQYEGTSPTVYEGYKPKQTWHIDHGVRDQIEHYNINRHVERVPQPQALRPFVPLMEAFAKHNFFNILHPVLRLLAIGLELPEDTLIKDHDWDGEGFTTIRFMKYHPRSTDEEEKTKNVWLKGHTDFGSITILWSQPVAGLQILSPDGKWRWVRHMENAVVINAGDALEFLCGGYYPPTRHRVIQPPSDQANIPRYGLFFFVMPNDNVKLIPHEESPVLQKQGVHRLCDPKDAPRMEDWRKERTKSYGKVELKMGKEKGVEEEIVSGVIVKHYN
ncbi:hypothetical protein BDQ12DRAFT_660738 [Crucibulum laeve]|uniref:Fe2OG dioxygenase domain-containing protein n=1 Tax=Crucibulum laeve TaxID=68775 RepID=A0A5C3LEK7_9AGAR|nr:hypothetical protein BDQ12DRAFT_660738 [Crucibulum laeve]